MNSDKVIAKGMVKPDCAANGWGEVKEGLENKYVFRGFACVVHISVSGMNTSRGRDEDRHARIYALENLHFQRMQGTGSQLRGG